MLNLTSTPLESAAIVMRGVKQYVHPFVLNIRVATHINTQGAHAMGNRYVNTCVRGVWVGGVGRVWLCVWLCVVVCAVVCVVVCVVVCGCVRLCLGVCECALVWLGVWCVWRVGREGIVSWWCVVWVGGLVGVWVGVCWWWCVGVCVGR